MARNDGERRQALVCVLAETRKPAAIVKSRDYFTKRCLEFILVVSQARGMDMQSAHLAAIINEWPVSNGTRHGAQRIFPAADGSQHVREVFEFCRGHLEGPTEGPLGMHLYIPVLLS